MIVDGVMVAVVMAFAEALKRMGFPSKFIPAVNIIAGILASFVWDRSDWVTAVFTGVVVGLTASGAYSGTKNIIQGIKGEDKK